METDLPSYTLPAETDIGHVHLKVADLERALAFYLGVLGFELTSRFGSQAAFVSAGGYHHHIGLNTWESRGGTPPPPGRTGLYHVAIRYPTRAGARGRGPPRPRGRDPTPGRRGSRRQRGGLPGRSGPERRGALLGPAARAVAALPRGSAGHVHRASGPRGPVTPGRDLTEIPDGSTILSSSIDIRFVSCSPARLTGPFEKGAMMASRSQGFEVVRGTPRGLARRRGLSPPRNRPAPVLLRRRQTELQDRHPRPAPG